MNSAAYLLSFGVSILTTLAAIFGVSLVTDPFGISPFSDVVPGANTLRLSRNGNDLLIKPFDIIREQPRVLFLGSSRIKRSIDPDALAGLVKGRIYNGAADGQVLPFSAGLLDLALRYDRNVQDVYIELFNYPILGFGPSPGPMYRITVRDLLDNVTRMTVGPSARLADVQTLYSNIALNAGLKFPAFTHLSGFYPAENSPTMGGAIIDWTNGESLKSPLETDKVSDSLVPFLQALTAKARRHGVRINYFIAPFHTWIMYGYYFYDDWHNLEEMKRRLAKLGNVYDFMRFNELTDEKPAPRMNYWRDTFHFTPQLGSLVARRLLGQTSAGMPKNFGVLLTPKNVEQELTAFRRERDEWIARNPMVVQNYENAKRAAAAKISTGSGRH